MEVDPFPLPRINETLQKLEKFKSATALDLSLGFYLIPLDKESQKVYSTILPWGEYAYLRMPMGVSCAPSMFQSIMTETLRGLDVLVYIDDILIIQRESQSTSEHLIQVEEVLNQDMATLCSYFEKWRLQLSESKTTAAIFHLNNKEAKREIKVQANGRLLKHQPAPKYLGVKLDRSLTFRQHLVALRSKLVTRAALMRRLVGSGWVSNTTALRTSALALVYVPAEYCTPAWSRSSTSSTHVSMKHYSS